MMGSESEYKTIILHEVVDFFTGKWKILHSIIDTYSYNGLSFDDHFDQRRNDGVYTLKKTPLRQ